MHSNSIRMAEHGGRWCYLNQDLHKQLVMYFLNIHFFVIYFFMLWPMMLVGFLGEAKKIFDLFEKI